MYGYAHPLFFSNSHPFAAGQTSIVLEEYGIRVTIPQWTTYYHDDISVEAIPMVPADFVLQEDEAVISVGLKFSPPSLKFISPVKITMPHCAHIPKPEQSTVKLYTRISGI